MAGPEELDVAHNAHEHLKEKTAPVEHAPDAVPDVLPIMDKRTAELHEKVMANANKATIFQRVRDHLPQPVKKYGGMALALALGAGAGYVGAPIAGEYARGAVAGSVKESLTGTFVKPLEGFSGAAKNLPPPEGLIESFFYLRNSLKEIGVAGIDK